MEGLTTVNGFNQLNFIVGNDDYFSGEVVSDPDDKRQLKRLLDINLYEYPKGETCSAFVIHNTLVSLLAIICRNTEVKAVGSRTFADEKFKKLLHFISFNILDQEKLSVRYLTHKFHISESYFNEYFKRHAGERFQNFVLKTKIRVATYRANYADASFQDIVLELGFTDSSRLDRMIQKYEG